MKLKNMSGRKNKCGVKTPEGKAITRYNAQKHGILRETLTEYEKVDAEMLFNELSDDLQPEGRMQEILVEGIVSNVVRLERLTKAEGEHIKFALTPTNSFFVNPMKSKDYEPLLPIGSVENLMLFSRYQTAIESKIYRALNVLRDLKVYEQSKKTT